MFERSEFCVSRKRADRRGKRLFTGASFLPTFSDEGKSGGLPSGFFCCRRLALYCILIFILQITAYGPTTGSPPDTGSFIRRFGTGEKMLYIVWKESNDLGIQIIDEQHRGVISIINSYYYFMQEGHGIEMPKATMHMMADYTEVHFRTEEDLMAKADYPGLKEHVRLHKRLTRRTWDIAENPAFHESPDDVLKFLKEWWLGRIGGEDGKYVPYVKKIL